MSVSRKLYINRPKRLLKITLIASSLFLSGFAAYSLFSYTVKSFGFPLRLNQPFTPLVVMALVSVLLYKPFDLFYAEIFKRYLFKKRSYVHMVLMNLADELETVLDLQELSNLVVNTFADLFHLKTVALAVRSEESDDFHIASAYGWNVAEYRSVHLTQKSPVVSYMNSNGAHALVRNQAIRVLDWQDANRLAYDFDRLRASWIVPLMVNDALAGFLAFSAYQPDRTFSQTDFHFFRKFSRAVANKVFNAMRFTRLEKAAEELKDTQSKLMQMMKLTAIEQLATGLAHQIHNPLTIISGKAQVLLLQKDRVPLDERVQDVLKTIVKQTKRAADITKKLLMFSQGSNALREGLNLEQVLDDTLALVSYQTSLDHIEIVKSIDPELPSVFGNVQELREVFLNLILNAVQSLQSAGDRGRVQIQMNYHPVERTVQVRVSDTGGGIPQDHIEKLFNPFFTTRHEALGLGLFVTKQIIHRMGGSIRVESRMNEGSIFIVALPVTESTVTAEQAVEFIPS